MPKIIILSGSVLGAIGLVCLLASLGQSHSADIRALGSASFTGGVILVAFGLLLLAHRLRQQYRETILKVKKTERLCSQCSEQPALLFCRVHVQRLCLTCAEKHDSANCSYVPSSRAVAAYKQV